MKQFLLFFLLSIFIIVGVVFLNKYQKGEIIQKPALITPAPAKVISPTEAKPENKSISLKLFEVSNSMVVSDPTLLIKGKTVADAEVFVDNQELKAGKNGEFSAKVGLDEGENVIIITVNDGLGNTAEKELTVNLETNE